METPLSAPPPSEVPLAPPTAQTGRRSGKKKKKRGRKPKDKNQVDSLSTMTQSGPDNLSASQQQLIEQNSRTPVTAQGVGGAGGGGVGLGGVLSHPLVHSGDDVLRTSREQMEFESRRSIGSSSLISSLAPSNSHVINNNFGSNQAQPVSESGQSRLTDHRTPSAPVISAVGSSEVSTPPRDTASVGVAFGLGGLVRVKQEPITNHEEEMETNHPPSVTQHPRQPTTKVRYS